MIKFLFLLSVGLCSALVSTACTVCEKQQPKILRGISHGAGPQSQWDMVIVALTAAIVVATLVLSIKWIIRPGETDRDHIKRSIFK